MNNSFRSSSALARWVVAVLIVMAAAVPVMSTIVRFSGMERSTWVSIVLDRDQPKPPAMRVAYGEGPDQTLPVSWESSERRTLLGLKTDAPVKLLSIDTDRGLAPPWLAQTWAASWQRVAEPPALLLRGSGVIDIDGTFERFTLTFEPSNATVQIGWLGLHETVHLAEHAGRPYSVTLVAPRVHTGWVLLPPIAIDRIALQTDSPQSLALRELTVHGVRRQTWSARPSGGRLLGSDGQLRLDGWHSLNRVSTSTRLLIWLGVTVSGVGCLWGLAILAARARRTTERYELVRTRVGDWVRDRTRSWTLGRVMAGVTACSAAYHLSYALAVPPHFNFDSLGYYAFGRNFLHTHHLASIATCRTPGYPAAIAASILLFGDQMLALVVTQHLALCVLGVVVVWFLYPRVGPLWSAAAGLLAGMSPAMSVTANAIWTEALFMALATAALLSFLYAADPRPLDLAVAGVLAGAATLVRPNGVVIVALMLLWLFLRWWCDPAGQRVRRRLASAMLILAAYVLVTLPWMVHFHRVAGYWALSDINCGQPGQTHPAMARGLQPTNVFQLAGFVNLTSQSDTAAALAITEPHRVFFEFFPARHRYHVEQFLPWDLLYDDRYTGEVFREYVRTFSRTYLRQVREALVFNLTHHEPSGSSIFMYPDVADVVALERTRTYPMMPTRDARVEAISSAASIGWPDAALLLTQMSGWAPANSTLRSVHLDVNRAAMWLWGALFLLGAAGGVVCLALPGSRRFVVLAWHALVLAGAPAILAMGVDRYAMVGEPSLYVLAAFFMSLTLQYRVRRRGAPSVVATDEGVVA